MSIRLPYLGLPALILILVTAAACDGTNSAVTAPAAKPGANALLTTEPATLRSETLTGSCPAGTPFGTRLGVVVRGTQSLIVTDLHFRFIDRNGRTAFPDVIAIRSLSAPLPDSSIPTASPIPFPSPSALPGASPIPIPGSLPIEGILLNGGSSRTFPFFLRFDCGVIGDGTLVIVADTTDANGRSMRPELRVRLAE
jgi:hypothetical protein